MDVKLIINSGSEYTGYDVDFDGQDFVLIQDADEISQRIVNRVKLFKDEWYLYQGGIDWIKDVFNQPEGSIVARDTIVNEISNTDGVQSVDTIELVGSDAITRTSQFLVTVTTDTGLTATTEIQL